MTRFAGLLVMLCACGGTHIPDPKDTVQKYTRAIAARDAKALHALLSEDAERGRSVADVERALAVAGADAVDYAKAFEQEGTRYEAWARLETDEGKEVTLSYRDNGTWVHSAELLPGGGNTPEDALRQLGKALARRNLTELLRVLSPTTRERIEKELSELAMGLKEANTLRLEMSGDTGKVPLLFGHVVRLKRKGGVWRVESFQ